MLLDCKLSTNATWVLVTPCISFCVNVWAWKHVAQYCLVSRFPEKKCLPIEPNICNIDYSPLWVHTSLLKTHIPIGATWARWISSLFCCEKVWKSPFRSVSCWLYSLHFILNDQWIFKWTFEAFLCFPAHPAAATKKVLVGTHHLALFQNLAYSFGLFKRPTVVLLRGIGCSLGHRGIGFNPKSGAKPPFGAAGMRSLASPRPLGWRTLLGWFGSFFCRFYGFCTACLVGSSSVFFSSSLLRFY